VQLHCVKRQLGSKLDYLLSRRVVSDWLRQIRPDLLHAHYATSYGWLGARAEVNCPRLLTVWGTDIAVSPVNNPLLDMLVRRSLARYDWINAPSEHLSRRLVEMGVPEGKIEVFPYGIDLTHLPMKPARVAARLRAVSIRGWSPEYRVVDVVRGFAAYAAERDDLDLVITGYGTEEERRTLLQAIAATGCGDRIRFAGFVTRAELLEILYSADVFLSIPKSDGAPTSLLEAMAIGLFPLVSDIVANREWVEPPDAVIVGAFDPESVKEALRQAVARVRNGFSPEPNRRIVEARADYARNTERLRSVYQRFLNPLR
jgi:glycosyltransferase involved in cell wall biosynthesis